MTFYHVPGFIHWFQYSLMHPEQIIGSNLVQRPQPVTIPNSNFHIIITSRRPSWKTTINSAEIIPYSMDKSVHYIRQNKMLFYVTNNKSAFTGTAIALTHNRTDSQSHWLTIALTHNRTDSKSHWLTIALTHNRTDSQSHWFTIALTHNRQVTV